MTAQAKAQAKITAELITILHPGHTYTEIQVKVPTDDPVLQDLRDRYDQLKERKQVIWKTREGLDLLTRLDKVRASGRTRTAIAAAMGVHRQGLDAMLKQPRTRRKLRKWPTAEDMGDLRTAWTRWSPRLPREEPEFVLIHQALQGLLDRGFEDYEIALALSRPPFERVSVRTLRRFKKRETDAQTRARAIKKILDES